MPLPTISTASILNDGSLLRIHDITYGSSMNGPGHRNVLHLQGCTIGCPGCFSEHTWSSDGGKGLLHYELATKLLLAAPAEGITISGGEPFQQTTALVKLLEHFQQHAPFKTVVIFTGFTRKYLEKQGTLDRIQGLVDVIVAGPYVESKRIVGELRGSSNQEIMLLSEEYTLEETIPPATFEVLMQGGEAIITGFPTLEDKEALVTGLGEG